MKQNIRGGEQNEVALLRGKPPNANDPTLFGIRA